MRRTILRPAQPTPREFRRCLFYLHFAGVFSSIAIISFLLRSIESLRFGLLYDRRGPIADFLWYTLAVLDGPGSEIAWLNSVIRVIWVILVGLLFYWILRITGVGRRVGVRVLTIFGAIGFCKKCLYHLDIDGCSEIRCPECGTVNDASKWLINREGKSDEGQESA